MLVCFHSHFPSIHMEHHAWYSHSHSGPHGRPTGGNRLILHRYDLVSIQAHLSLFTPRWRRLLQPVEQRTQAALGAFKQADPAWIQPPQKWLTKESGIAWTPTDWKSPPFSTLIYLCCRRGRKSPGFCSLPPILPFYRLRGTRQISWKWEEA